MRLDLRVGALIGAAMLSGCNEGVLDPKGPVAAAERLILFNSLGIMLAIVIPMMAAMFLLVAFVSWRSEKKFVEPQQVALSGDGIQYASRDASGLLV